MLLALEEYLDARPPAKPLRPSNAPLPGAPGVVTAKAEPAKPATVAPGDEFEVELGLTIKDNFHIYANPAGSEDVIPTVVSSTPGSRRDPGRGPLPARRVQSPRRQRPGKGGRLREERRRRRPEFAWLADAKTGPTTINLKVRYQACDDKACLAPATLDVPVTVEVKAK